jgi:hypothetical protein
MLPGRRGVPRQGELQLIALVISLAELHDSNNAAATAKPTNTPPHSTTTTTKYIGTSEEGLTSKWYRPHNIRTYYDVFGYVYVI